MTKTKTKIDPEVAELIEEANKVAEREKAFAKACKAIKDYQDDFERRVREHERKLEELVEGRGVASAALARSNRAKDVLLSEHVTRELVEAQSQTETKCTKLHRKFDEAMAKLVSHQDALRRLMDRTPIRKPTGRRDKKTGRRIFQEVKPPKLSKAQIAVEKDEIAKKEKIVNDLRAKWKKAEAELASLNENIDAEWKALGR